MTTLNFYATDPIDELMFPEQNSDLSLDTPALNVLTDFKIYDPVVITNTTPVSHIESQMKQSHVRLKLVVNDRGHFLGVVSSEDIADQEIIKKISQGYTREELTAADFMRPRESLKSIAYDELAHAAIRDLIEALQHNGQQHCLVVDQAHHKIRGIISASDIARKLKLAINIQKKSSFAEIFKTIHPHINQPMTSMSA